MGTVLSNKWGTNNNSPQIELITSWTNVNETTAKILYTLNYKASNAVSSSNSKAWSIVIGGVTRASGSFAIGGKTGTKQITSGSFNVTRTTQTQSFKCYATMDIKITWNGVYAEKISTHTDTITINTLPSYKVHYDANGGVNPPSPGTKWHGVDFYVSNVVPTRTNYAFQGWIVPDRYGSSFNDIHYQPGSLNQYNGNQTLVAYWRKWIGLTFDANGGSGAPAVMVYTVDNATTHYNFTIPNTRPTRTGYTFQGWRLGDPTTGSIVQPGETVSLSESVTAYAVWNLLTYQVSYDVNGGVGVISYATKKYGVNLTITSYIPTRKGYRFLGWSPNKNAIAPSILSGGTYTSNANVVLYAVWEHLNTVHIKTSGAYRDGELYIKSGGTWYKGIPYINIDGVWKEGGI